MVVYTQKIYMKKIYTFLFLFIALYGNAQIKPQTFFVGADIGFNAGTTEFLENKTIANNALISLQVGKAFKQNKIAGIIAGFSTQNNKLVVNGTDTAKNNSNAYNVGAFYRYYKQLGKDFYFFSQASFLYSYNRATSENLGSGNKYITNGNGVSLAYTPGISYQLFNKMQIELSIPNIIALGYSSTKSKHDVPNAPTSTNNAFSISSNLNNLSSVGALSCGVRFFL
jgi:hypothetical protein